MPLESLVEPAKRTPYELRRARDQYENHVPQIFQTRCPLKRPTSQRSERPLDLEMRNGLS